MLTPVEADDPEASAQRRQALSYVRSEYSSTLDRYKVADAKAQLLLTLNGVYVTTLSAAAIVRSKRLSSGTFAAVGWRRWF